MGRKCPIDGEKKLYLDCLECEEKNLQEGSREKERGRKICCTSMRGILQ